MGKFIEIQNTLINVDNVWFARWEHHSLDIDTKKMLLDEPFEIHKNNWCLRVYLNDGGTWEAKTYDETELKKWLKLFRKI